MATGKPDLYRAAQILLVAASGRPGETLEEIAAALDEMGHPGALVAARRMLAESVDAGTWREARAEAALRMLDLVREIERAEWRSRSAAERARRRAGINANRNAARAAWRSAC